MLYNVEPDPLMMFYHYTSVCAAITVLPECTERLNALLSALSNTRCTTYCIVTDILQLLWSVYIRVKVLYVQSN